MNKRINFVVVLVVSLLIVPRTASAQYLDPGTGSMLLQGLIALLFAVMATIGIYWRGTSDFVRRKLLHRKPPAKSANKISE